MRRSGYATTGAIFDSVSYSSCVMPELAARITSGCVSATASKSMPSVSSKSTGVSAPSSSSLSSTQGSTPSASSSPHVTSAMPTGTTPSASGTSWFDHATVATRSGFDSITVSP